jgi:hypothetical protein
MMADEHKTDKCLYSETYGKSLWRADSVREVVRINAGSAAVIL